MDPDKSSCSRLSGFNNTYFRLCPRDVADSCISSLLTYVPPGVHVFIKDSVRIANAEPTCPWFLGIDNHGRFMIERGRSSHDCRLYVIDLDEGYTKYISPFMYIMPTFLIMYPSTAINSATRDRTGALNSYSKLQAYNDANGGEPLMGGHTWFYAENNTIIARMISMYNRQENIHVMDGKMQRMGDVDMFRQYCITRVPIDNSDEYIYILHIFNNLTQSSETSFEIARELCVRTGILVCGEYIIIYDTYSDDDRFAFRIFDKCGTLLHTMIDTRHAREHGHFALGDTVLAYPCPPARFAIVKLTKAELGDNDSSSYFCATRYTIIDGGKDGIYITK